VRCELIPLRAEQLERFLLMDLLNAQLRLDAGRLLHAT
jgi:hypothetical protein